MIAKEFEIFDYEEDKYITVEELFADETKEDIEYYIDLKINMIIDEIYQCSDYKVIKDTILDSEVYISNEFYYYLLSVSSISRNSLYEIISSKIR